MQRKNPSKKCKFDFSNDTSKGKISLLNPTVFHPRFTHIVDSIFDNLDDESLKNCREVSKSWQVSIDERGILWIKLFKNKDCNKAFQSSCQNGLLKIAQFLGPKIGLDQQNF